MRLRSGFVSNSSSSSFVCVGFKKDPYSLGVKELKQLCINLGVAVEKLTNDAEDLREMIMDVIDNNDYTWYTEEGIIGFEIAEGDYTLDHMELSLEEIVKISDDLVKKFGLAKEDVRLITGTYAC